LVKIDGTAKKAWFKDAEGNVSETLFNFIHVCPPQAAPQFIKNSDLSDSAGWLDCDPVTLQSKRYANVWGAGDVLNTPNAKTVAAARKQAPVVAQNIVNTFAGKNTMVSYDGYGSCPLTVERGKIVLAEFTYGGIVAPSFPKWINDGTKPTALAWFLKAKLLPLIYWYGMLKGREWLATPTP
jgi:sulfide:quinone oxidoreductase